jgi:Abortive infection alpha
MNDWLARKGDAMSREENGSKVDVDVGLSARASLEARVSTEIPAQSTGRLVDAITDLFRPFAERQGLKADLIRLQREDVLIEIAKKVYRRLEIENAVPSPVPTKFLIPFLEKASLEDKDGFLIDRWADLLTSSSIHPEGAHPRFVQILSELGSAEAKLLRDIALFKADNVREMKPELDRHTFVGLPDNFRRIFSSIRLVNDDPNLRCTELACKMMCLIAGPGSSVTDINVMGKREKETTSEREIISGWFQGSPGQHPANVRVGDNKFYIDLLCSLHLLNYYSVEAQRPDFERIEVSYVTMTPLGLEFLRRCDRAFEERILNASETVNHVRDNVEFCPKLYDPEWGRRGYRSTTEETESGR